LYHHAQRFKMSHIVQRIYLEKRHIYFIKIALITPSITPHSESSWILFLLVKGVFFYIKDVHMHVSYKSIQSSMIKNYIKSSPPMIFDQLSCKSLNIKWKNSPKMEFLFFETEIWYAWLALRKNWNLILLDQKYQLHFILCKDLWMIQ
jgi:hypothetical protein